MASGRLEPAKGFDLLIEAMAEVVRHFPQAHLTILGTGTLDHELRDQRARLWIGVGNFLCPLPPKSRFPITPTPTCSCFRPGT